MSHRFLRALSALAGATAALCACRPALAAFVIVDLSYTHDGTLKDSHNNLKPPPGTPANWQSPVDYAGGETWVRLEVKTKPSDAPTRYQVCFSLDVNYACTDQAPVYTSTGVYTWGTAVSNFWKPGPVDWSQGINTISLILKDDKNAKPSPDNVGASASARYMPTDLHVTVTLVPPGESYVPPPDAGAGEGGADADASPDDGSSAEVDATPQRDTGTDAAAAPDAPVSSDASVREAGSGQDAIDASGQRRRPTLPARRADAASAWAGPQTRAPSGCSPR